MLYIVDDNGDDHHSTLVDEVHVNIIEYILEKCNLYIVKLT